jgi:hypothetical protein
MEEKPRFTYNGKNSLIISLMLMASCVEQIKEFEHCKFEKAYLNFIDNPTYDVFFRDDCWHMDDGDPFHEYRYFKYGDVNL